MTIKLENVGIAVRDLEATIAFFTDLGLEVMGRDTVSGEWTDTAVGLDGNHAHIAMLRTPDGAGVLELFEYLHPEAIETEPTVPNQIGMHRVAFSVDDLDAALAVAATARLPPAARRRHLRGRLQAHLRPRPERHHRDARRGAAEGLTAIGGPDPHPAIPGVILGREGPGGGDGATTAQRGGPRVRPRPRAAQRLRVAVTERVGRRRRPDRVERSAPGLLPDLDGRSTRPRPDAPGPAPAAPTYRSRCRSGRGRVGRAVPMPAGGGRAPEPTPPPARRLDGLGPTGAGPLVDPRVGPPSSRAPGRGSRLVPIRTPSR